MKEDGYSLKLPSSIDSGMQFMRKLASISSRSVIPPYSFFPPVLPPYVVFTAILAFAKICLRQRRSGSVDSNKNLGDRFDIQVFRQFNDADVIKDDSTWLDDLEHLILRGVRIRSAVVADKLKSARGRIKDLGYIRNPSGILPDRWVSNLEEFVLRIERNTIRTVSYHQ